METRQIYTNYQFTVATPNPTLENEAFNFITTVGHELVKRLMTTVVLPFDQCYKVQRYMIRRTGLSSGRQARGDRKGLQRKDETPEFQMRCRKSSVEVPHGVPRPRVG